MQSSTRTLQPPIPSTPGVTRRWEVMSAGQLTAEAIPIRGPISYSSRCFSCLFKVQFHLFCLSIHNLSLKSSNGSFHPNRTRNRCFRAWNRTYPWQELGFTGPDLAAHQRRRGARPDYRYWHLPFGLARVVYSCGIWRDVSEGSGP
jgi:hypothetical protein